MLRLCLIIIYSLSFQVSFSAEKLNPEVVTQFDGVEEEINASLLPPVGDCVEDKLTDIDREVIKRFTTNRKGKQFELSGISMEYAEYLFNKVANDPDIPFDYPRDGCYARAYKMANILQEEGVKVGKVFVEGDLQVTPKDPLFKKIKWWYHVAPIVTVKTGRVIEEKYEVTGSRIKRTRIEEEYVPMVIDPSIADRPITIKEWVAIQTKHDEAKVDELYVSPKFNIFPEDKNRNLTSYREGDIEYTENKLIEFNDIVDQINEYKESLK